MSNITELPGAITSYINAQNAFDVDGLVNVFDKNAVILDEHKRYEGQPAIRTWNIATNEQYRTQMAALEFTQGIEQYNVVIEMTGTFPGSPARANFCFKIKGNKIAALEIT